MANLAVTYRAFTNSNEKMNYLNTGIGVLGGTFDPIHLGHTQSAQVVADELGLNTILLIPAHIPPHKTTADLVPHASPEQRAAMVEIACQENQFLSCDLRELNRSGHSYTVDTLKELKRQYPDRPLHFIIGMDSLLTFTRWHQYQEILSLCHIVVNTRPNYSKEQLNKATKQLLSTHQALEVNELNQSDFGKIYFTKSSFFDISSTKIRQNLVQQQSCHQLLLPSIIEFINKNKLYR